MRCSRRTRDAEAEPDGVVCRRELNFTIHNNIKAAIRSAWTIYEKKIRSIKAPFVPSFSVFFCLPLFSFSQRLSSCSSSSLSSSSSSSAGP
eukprot:2793012-Rhodomonas_salina.1